MVHAPNKMLPPLNEKKNNEEYVDMHNEPVANDFGSHGRWLFQDRCASTDDD